MTENETFDKVLAFLEKRNERTDEDIFKESLEAREKIPGANAVAVPVRGYPYLVKIDDFKTLRNGYCLHPADKLWIGDSVEFPVACYNGWKKEDGSENRLANRFDRGISTFRGTCLYFGWEKDAPAPLTYEQANALCDFITPYRIRMDRGSR